MVPTATFYQFYANKKEAFGNGHESKANCKQVDNNRQILNHSTAFNRKGESFLFVL